MSINFISNGFVKIKNIILQMALFLLRPTPSYSYLWNLPNFKNLTYLGHRELSRLLNYDNKRTNYNLLLAHYYF